MDTLRKIPQQEDFQKDTSTGIPQNIHRQGTSEKGP
mgnify:FL=1